MQLWFSRGAKVSLREQLVTQVVLGILCGDLKSGDRLPSIRELARRFRLHPNTISAGYRQLERERWVALRRGSGVYVCDAKPDAPASSSIALDQLIVNFFRVARKIGAPVTLLHDRLRHWLDLQPPDHFLLIEPREELRRILVHEMQHHLAFSVKGCGLNPAEFVPLIQNAVPVALSRNLAVVRKYLPVSTDVITLSIRSVPSSLAEWLPSPAGILVAIASGWPEFLKLARTMLIAAGFHHDALILRDTRRHNWHRGLQHAAAVVCDSLTAASLPKSCRAIVFPVLSESSLRELREYEQFVRDPV